MAQFGPPAFNWDGGLQLLSQKQAVAGFFVLASIDAGAGNGIVLVNQNNQQNGYQIIASTSWFTTVPPGSAAVLPETTAPNSLSGMMLIVINQGANALLVYPNPNDTSNGINNGSANIPVTVSAGTKMFFHCFAPGFWVAQ